VALVLSGTVAGCLGEGGGADTTRDDRPPYATRTFRELERRPVDLPSVHVPRGVSRAAREFRSVAGHCWTWGAPDVGAIALPSIPGEAALGPWPPGAGSTVSRSGSSTDGANPERGETVLRRGPVYAALLAGPPRIVYLGEPSKGESRWQRVRTIWASRPSYDGPVLVRGGRLDRLGRLGFGSRVRPRWELRLPAGSWPPGNIHPGGGGRPLGEGWRLSSVPTRIRAPGCYAFQVDGLGFSYLLEFGAQGQ
jgi:hypothetical protein